MNFLASIIKSFSQVFLIDNIYLGGLIVLGLGITSPFGLGIALIGSITSYITSFLLGLPKDIMANGRFGYNSVLIGIALLYYFKNVPQAIVFTIMLSVIATILFLILYRNNIPPFAAPFVISIWLLLLVLKYLK